MKALLAATALMSPIASASVAEEGRYIAVAPSDDDYSGVYMADTATGSIRYCSIEYSSTTREPPQCSDWLEE